MTHARNVIVVGLGLSGFAAAIAARRAGANVAVLGASGGASALAPGILDVVPFDVPGSSTNWADTLRAVNVEGRLKRLHECASHHVYARRDLTRHASVVDASSAVIDALGVYHQFDIGAGARICATDLGLLRAATTFQNAILQIDPAPAGRIAVVEGIGEFAVPAAQLVNSLRAQADACGLPIEFEVVSLNPEQVFASSALPARPPTTNMQWALAFDDARLQSQFFAMLKARFRERDLRALLFPAVLAYSDGAFVERCREETGLAIGEVAAVRGGVQGQRLALALRRSLEHAGCELAPGRWAERAVVEPDGVRLEFASGESVHAERVVLATGKYLGGGLALTNGDVRERLFGLPLYLHGRPLAVQSAEQGRDPLHFFGSSLRALGPGFEAGVGYDMNLNALTRGEEVFSERVFAAGALLDAVRGGYDPCGFGIAAYTGTIAGLSAAA